MNFRRETEREQMADTRDEVRELAEAVGLYRSAMRHLTDRDAARPWAVPAGSQRHSWKTLRIRLLLVPALAAALLVAVLAPRSGYFQHESSSDAGAVAQSPVQNNNTEARAGVDDTVLMNQIDSEISQEVPDALEPLADLSQQATTNTQSVSEKRNVTQN